MRTIILFLFVLAFIACEDSDDLKIDSTSDLLGYWITPAINDTIYTYERANALKDNDYGFAFKSDQVFIERKNSGECATPPIAYSDFEGNWSANDSIINITVEYWGGMADYKWKIVKLDNTSLSLSKLEQEYNYEE